MTGRILPCALAALFVTASVLAAPRETGEAQLQAMLKGRTARAPVSCVSLVPSLDSTTIPGAGIVYKNGRTLYVNRFDRGCPSLTAFTALVTRTPSSQLCRGDIARVVDFTTRIENGSCVFGDFIPYTKAK